MSTAEFDRRLSLSKGPPRYTLSANYGWTKRAVRLDVDLGDDGDMDALDAHLAERGLGINDLLAAVDEVVPRRKGDRLYAYGRGLGGKPIVAVMQRRGSAWRPRTAWPMDEVEERWWRRHGGR